MTKCIQNCPWRCSFWLFPNPWKDPTCTYSLCQLGPGLSSSGNGCSGVSCLEACDAQNGCLHDRSTEATASLSLCLPTQSAKGETSRIIRDLHEGVKLWAGPWREKKKVWEAVCYPGELWLTLQTERHRECSPSTPRLSVMVKVFKMNMNYFCILKFSQYAFTKLIQFNHFGLSTSEGQGRCGSVLPKMTWQTCGRPGLVVRPSDHQCLALWNLFTTGPGLELNLIVLGCW